jgi:hypothetical protein
MTNQPKTQKIILRSKFHGRESTLRVPVGDHVKVLEKTYRAAERRVCALSGCRCDILPIGWQQTTAPHNGVLYLHKIIRLAADVKGEDHA